MAGDVVQMKYCVLGRLKIFSVFVRSISEARLTGCQELGQKESKYNIKLPSYYWNNHCMNLFEKFNEGYKQ